MTRLRGIFDTETAKIEASLLTLLNQSLNTVKSDLVKANEIDKARLVETYRSSLVKQFPVSDGKGVSLPTASVDKTSDGWIDLFNGRDLNNWLVRGDKRDFKVGDGILQVRKNGRSGSYLLLTKGDSSPIDIKNFEMRCSVKATGKANSGVYFHVDLENWPSGSHPPTGYEIQLDNHSKPDLQTGALYDVEAPKFVLSDQDDWFEMRILVENNRVRCYVDGKLIQDYTERANSSRVGFRKNGGVLAIQANSKDGVWFFRDIEIRELP